MLFATPSTESIPFIDAAYVTDVMRIIVKRGIDEQGWQPMLDIIKEISRRKTIIKKMHF